MRSHLGPCSCCFSTGVHATFQHVSGVAVNSFSDFDLCVAGIMFAAWCLRGNRGGRLLILRRTLQEQRSTKAWPWSCLIVSRSLPICRFDGQRNTSICWISLKKRGSSHFPSRLPRAATCPALWQATWALSPSFAGSYPTTRPPRQSTSKILRPTDMIEFMGSGDSSLHMAHILKFIDMSSHERNDGHLKNTPDSESIDSIRQYWCDESRTRTPWTEICRSSAGSKRTRRYTPMMSRCTYRTDTVDDPSMHQPKDLVGKKLMTTTKKGLILDDESDEQNIEKIFFSCDESALAFSHLYMCLTMYKTRAAEKHDRDNTRTGSENDGKRQAEQHEPVRGIRCSDGHLQRPALQCDGLHGYCHWRTADYTQQWVQNSPVSRGFRPTMVIVKLLKLLKNIFSRSCWFSQFRPRYSGVAKRSEQKTKTRLWKPKTRSSVLAAAAKWSFSAWTRRFSAHWRKWLRLHGRQVHGSQRRRVRKDNIRENMDQQDDHSRDQSWSDNRNREDANRSKDRNPDRRPATRGQRKSPYGKHAAKRLRIIRRWNNRNDYKTSGRYETQESQSKTDEHRKRKKRKGSEPCVEVEGLEDENPLVNPDEEPADTKRWMTDTLRDLKQRTDEVSDLVGSVSRMQLDMGEVKGELKQSQRFTGTDDGGKWSARSETRRIDQKPIRRISRARKKHRSKIWENGKTYRRKNGRKTCSSSHKDQFNWKKCDERWKQRLWRITEQMGPYFNESQSSIARLLTGNQRSWSERTCYQSDQRHRNEGRTRDRLPGVSGHTRLRDIWRYED